jgi:hypothetical protein
MSSLPPLVELTAENRAGAVVVLAYTLIISTALFCAVRLAAAFFLRRGLGIDDALIVAATVSPPRPFLPDIHNHEQVIGLVQTILVEHAAISGIGRHSLALSTEETAQAMRVCCFNVMDSNVADRSVLVLQQYSVDYIPGTCKGVVGAHTATTKYHGLEFSQTIRSSSPCYYCRLDNLYCLCSGLPV